MELKEKIKYSGTLEVVTGLHIGATNDKFEIGGIDKYVVRNPMDSKPYIPGSSLKGKLRSLLEIANKTISNDGGPTKNPKDLAGMLFGTCADKKGNNSKDSGESNTSQKEDKNIQVSRLIFRDAFLSENDNDFLEDNDYLNNYAEIKTEVSINRVTGAASTAGPRTFERIPKGAIFDVEIILNVYNNDNKDQLEDALETAFTLLQNDYLGGNGSRGYGQVKFKFGEGNCIIKGKGTTIWQSTK